MMKTKHEMPAMTEHERKELTADCLKEISQIEKNLATWGTAWVDYLNSQLNRQKIALAALTAEPDYWQFKYQKAWIGTGEEGARKLHEEGNDIRPLFLSPPVPTLKQVKLRKASDNRYWHNDGYGTIFRAGLFEDDVIIAIKAAGGTIEGDDPNER